MTNKEWFRLMHMLLPANVPIPERSGCMSGDYVYSKCHELGETKTWFNHEKPEVSCGDVDGLATAFALWRYLVDHGVTKNHRLHIMNTVMALLMTGEYLTCSFCGRYTELRWVNECNASLRENQLCFGCDHWARIETTKGHPDRVIVDNHSYMIDRREDTAFKGFGGTKFIIKFNDGREAVSTNLWHQGEIPWNWQKRIPNNAVFVKEEFPEPAPFPSVDFDTALAEYEEQYLEGPSEPEPIYPAATIEILRSFDYPDQLQVRCTRPMYEEGTKTCRITSIGINGKVQPLLEALEIAEGSDVCVNIREILH